MAPASRRSSTSSPASSGRTGARCSSRAARSSGAVRTRSRGWGWCGPSSSTKALSVMSVLDNMLLGNASNPGERLGLAAVRPAWRRAEREARARARRLARRVRSLGERPGLCRHALGRAAKAARARARAHARAAHAPPRRAAGRGQPDARTIAVGAHREPARRAPPDDPARRARHGRRHAPLGRTSS